MISRSLLGLSMVLALAEIGDLKDSDPVKLLDEVKDDPPPRPRQTTERDLYGPNHRPHQGAREIARRLRRIQSRR